MSLERYFRKAAHNYDQLYKRVKTARSPYNLGKPLNSAMRGFLREDPDYPAPVIDLYVHKHKVITVYPDNVLEFTATKTDFGRYAVSLTQVMHKVLPVVVERFAKGRYKIVTLDDDRRCADIQRPQTVWQERRKIAQEYFQHLKLDLTTGKVVSPKDMTPVVNEDKRKQWIAGLKAFRLKLRTLARLDLIEQPASKNYYISTDDQKYIADAIMRGECDAHCVDVLARNTSTWRVQRSGKPFGDCVVDTFENFIKGNSREVRAYLGVIDLVE